MDCRGQGRAAAAGNILLTRMAVNGAAGVVTDGTLRDIEEISRLPLPVFATGAAAMTNLAQHHAVDLQVPIGCAGVAVYPGDVMVGDADGVVCVPRHLVPVIAKAAREQERQEAFIVARVAAGAPLRGTYPPDEATRRDTTSRTARCRWPTDPPGRLLTVCRRPRFSGAPALALRKHPDHHPFPDRFALPRRRQKS
ncbi:hypothetical protein LUR56_20100 [Streptomyces sp. MT29]|nr:hypothetical protein [Streptomyces sp. MT29]